MCIYVSIHLLGDDYWHMFQTKSAAEWQQHSSAEKLMNIRRRSRVTLAFLLAVGLLISSQLAAQVEVVAIAEAIGVAYHAYKDVTELLGSGDPTQQDRMLDKLTALENDYTTKIQSKLDSIAKKIEDLIQFERRREFNDTRK